MTTLTMLLRRVTEANLFVFFFAGFSLTLVLVPRVVESKPYANYGFYSPYPPPRNQIIYDFQPMASPARSSAAAAAAASSRETRDLTWKAEYDALIDGHREPTCEELKEMWHLAREMHRQGQENARRQHGANHPFLSFAPLKSEVAEEEYRRRREQEDDDDDDDDDMDIKLKADRRRMSTPSQRRTMSKIAEAAAAAAASGPEEPVYGVVVTHKPASSSRPPSSPLHVRDPAKEIYRLLRNRERASKSGSQSRHRPQSNNEDNDDDEELEESRAVTRPHFGIVRTHERPKEFPDRDYFSQVKSEILGGDAASNSRVDEVVYGKLKEFEDASAAPPSPYDKVRALMAASKSNKGGQPNRSSSKTKIAFDRIKEKLMNSSSPPRSAAQRLRGKANKSFRRKSSKKRRRNIREIAFERRFLNGIIMSSKAAAAEAAERRRKGQQSRAGKSSSNNSKLRRKQQARKSRRKWRQLERERIQKQQSLLHQLG